MRKIQVLVSYYYWSPQIEQTLFENRDRVELLIDSGAFTAWKLKKVVTYEEFKEFYFKTFEELKPFGVFMLDVVGKHEETMANYKDHLSDGMKTIPIFTRGAPLCDLEEFYVLTDYVAIGGTMGTKNDKGFMKAVMERVGKRKIHWLGFGRREFLKHYQPFSFDSSSWTFGLRQGIVPLSDTQGRLHRIGPNDLKSSISSKTRSLLSLYGEDAFRARRSGEWRNSAAGRTILERISGRSAILLQRIMMDRLGSRLFHVCSTAVQIENLLNAQVYWEEFYAGRQSPSTFKWGHGLNNLTV